MAKRRPNGGGSIYQRKDGRYEAAAYVTYPDGTTRRLRLYAATWEEANKALTKALADHHAGIPTTTPGGLTLAAYLEDWLENVVRHKLRATTYPNYVRTVNLHINPYLGNKKLNKLTAQDVRTWYNTMRDTCQCCRQGIDAARGLLRQRCCAQGNCCRKLLATRTLHYIHGVLNTALAHAVREDLIPRNVVRQIQVPFGKTRPIDPFTAEEARTFLAHTADHPNAALYELAIRAGLRRGEILGLRWSDVNLDARTLTITQTLVRVAGQGIAFTPPKTDTSRRTIPLPEPVITALQRRRAEQRDDQEIAGDAWKETDLVFTGPTGRHLEPSGIHGEFQRLCDQAALRRIRFHDLRHTCATLLLEAGADLITIQHILGHAHIAITANTYTHVRLKIQHDAISKMNAILNDQPTLEPNANSDDHPEDTESPADEPTPHE